MENKLSLNEFQQIKINSTDGVYSKINRETFDNCIDNLDSLKLNDTEIDCIKMYVNNKLEYTKRTYKYFANKLIK